MKARRVIRELLAARLAQQGFRKTGDLLWKPVSSDVEAIILWNWTIPPPYQLLGIEPLITLRHVGLDEAWAWVIGRRPKRSGWGIATSLYKLVPGRDFVTGAWWFDLTDEACWADCAESLVKTITESALPYFSAHPDAASLLAIVDTEIAQVEYDAYPLLVWFTGDRLRALEELRLRTERWRGRLESDPLIAEHHLKQLERVGEWMARKGVQVECVD